MDGSIAITTNLHCNIVMRSVGCRTSSMRFGATAFNALKIAVVLLIALPSATRVRGDFTTVIHSPPESIANLQGIDSDTQLNLYDGAELPPVFEVGNNWGPNDNIEVNMFGGRVGRSLDVGGAFANNSNVTLSLYGGTIGADVHFGGSFGTNTNFTLNIVGGEIGRNLTVGGWDAVNTNFTVNISGGEVDELQLGWHGTNSGFVVNMSGGRLKRYLGIGSGTLANISGGVIDSALSVGGGGTVNLSGGVAGNVYATDSGHLQIIGGNFRVNGVPLSGLGIGQSLPLDVPSDGLLTGVLADGTPFAISNQRLDYITAGTLTLTATTLPAATPRTFHAPMDALPHGLRAGQSLVVSAGGHVPKNFTATTGTSITMTGGEIEEGLEMVGSVVDISGGAVGGLASVFAGSVFNLSGGSIGSNFYAGRGSLANIRGGNVGMLFETGAGSRVNFTGGTIDDILMVHAGSEFVISGGEFRLNGSLIGGLNAMGSTRAIDIPANAVLSGTLADGRPFAFSDQLSDYIDAGTLTLKSASLPTAGPAVFQVTDAHAPQGLRTGQSLIVEDGGVVGDAFNANWGTAVTVNGGRLGNNFEATGAVVNITGGSVGYRFKALYGSLVNISGGTIDRVLFATRGSVVNFSGGSLVDSLIAKSGSVVNISGGDVGAYLQAYSGSVVNFSGGAIGHGGRLDGATFNMSGGTLGDDFAAYGDSYISLSGGTIGERFQVGGKVRIAGNDFRLNGVPIEGFEYVGSEVRLDIPTGAVLSGTLLDGTPFAFARTDKDAFASDALRLEKWDVLPASPAVIQLPVDGAPAGIRAGQSLIVNAGGKVGDNFGVGYGSALAIVGGEVGNNCEAVGATVTMTGGKLGEYFDAFFGTTVNILGGTIGGGLEAHAGSTIHISGGTVLDLNALGGSTVNISGGLVDRISSAEAGSSIHLFGTGFRLDEEPIGNLIPGEMISVRDREVYLSGWLADGSPFQFSIDRYRLSVDALLTITSVLYGDYNGDGSVDQGDYVVWRKSLGSTIALAADGNGNRVVDHGDYDVWRANFGRVAGGATSSPIDGAAVPEPVAGVWVVIGVAAARWRRRRV
ncbi:MAG: hypothetical protein U0805_14345 [Pirellulales bacterium]